MNFFEDIRKEIGYKLLCRRVSKLKRANTFHNLNTAGYIGVVFNAQSETEYKAAKVFIDSLCDAGKKVETVGILNESISLGKYVITNEMRYLPLDMKTFFFLPKHPEVADTFVSQKFDMLINISNEENLAVDYLMGLSKAYFKVSPQLRNDDFADFMISFGEKKDLDTKTIAEKIKEYLAKMQKPAKQ